MHAGATDEALRYLEDAYARDPSASEMMELGVAYLWVGSYGAASDHFITAVKEQPVVGDAFYAMAGAAAWCLGNPREAIARWTNGLSCGYTDWAGGVTLPLLLFFASVVRSGVFSQREAKEILSRRLSSPLAETWPAGLAEFVLGRINLLEVRRKYECLSEGDELVCEWWTQFYVGVLAFAHGNLPQYVERMQAAAKTCDDDFDSSKGQFLGKLWHAEFFIARYELANQ